MAWKRDSEEATAVVSVCDMTGVVGVEELINYVIGWMICIWIRAQDALLHQAHVAHGEAPKMSATADANVFAMIGAKTDAVRTLLLR